MTDNAEPADLSAANEITRRFNRDLKEVVREITGWRVWHSSSGDLYATWPHQLSGDDISRGLAQTLAADDPAGLVEQINRQLDLAAQLAEEASAQASV